MKSSVSARLNADLLDEKFEQWNLDPQSVEPTWAMFFEGFELGVTQSEVESGAGAAQSGSDAAGQAGVSLVDRQTSQFRGGVTTLIYNFRTIGHASAWIDPLQSEAPDTSHLEASNFGFSEEDLEQEIVTQLHHSGQKAKLKDIVADLKAAYCGFSGFEFMHIHNSEVRNWIRHEIESRGGAAKYSDEVKVRALRWLLEAELFEKFLGKKFLGEKRFSLEGGEGLLVLLNTILEDSPGSGVEEMELGMAHRGRLNVLANFLRKSMPTILYEFTPNYVPDLVAGDGDVKYHLGYEKTREVNGKKVRLSLAANPSHLEAVNAVVEGKARARQRLIGDDIERKRVLPLLMHGDAAFAGQGSVAEVLNLSQLPGYRTGGTIHLIVNNQIGFTTMPADARSSSYATDVAKMIEAPIIHVNGEKPEELVWAAKFALEFRQKFGRDVVIDMICYRRQGHNETDQAAFTQPHIYSELAKRDPIGQLYKRELVELGVLDEAEAEKIEKTIWDEMEADYEKMREHEKAGDKTVFSGSTAEPQPSFSFDPIVTGVTEQSLRHIGKVLTSIPDGFNLHPTLAKRFVPRRVEALDSGQNFDWAFAESLAWGTLVQEGHPVRLSGQDCRRGTFSQRHAVFYDAETRERYIPLEHVSDDQGKFCVYNSLLSEAAVLGFDYGYSLGVPNMLTMWEAQFGDFANGAQVIIDQFIASAESKWQTPTSLVLLLPHGYEGMGPEHSSARLERFLQLCAGKNMIVGNLTTPAQYFHALRRQKKQPYRKPLVLMTPKSLLTRPDAVSKIEDFIGDTTFQEVIQDRKALKRTKKIKRLVFCSGKVFYDLRAHQEENDIVDTAIVRVEQLYPFHADRIAEVVGEFANVETFVWCQEEPRNMGSWYYIWGRLQEVIGKKVLYAGRGGASSPAAGSKAQHKREQQELLDAAFSVKSSS